MPFASFHGRCFLSYSAILVRRQVCCDLPLFRFHCGFHSSALLTTCPSGLLNVWPIHPQALFLTSRSISRCPGCLSPKLLVAHFSRPPNPQDVPQALIDEHLQLLLPTNLLVSLHISEPYKSTAFTFEPKTLSLVLVVSAVDRHIGLRIILQETDLWL